MNDPLMPFLLYTIGFIIAVFITRAIFSIGTIVKHLRAQTILLSELAKRQGVNEELVKMVILKTDATVNKL